MLRTALLTFLLLSSLVALAITSAPRSGHAEEEGGEVVAPEGASRASARSVLRLVQPRPGERIAIDEMRGRHRHFFVAAGQRVRAFRHGCFPASKHQFVLVVVQYRAWWNAPRRGRMTMPSALENRTGIDCV